MRLARVSRDGGEPFWGVVDAEGESLRPITGRFEEWAPAVTAGSGEAALRFSGGALPIAACRLLAPMEATARVMVAGVNYAKHLPEFGVSPPAQPFAFLKANRALLGANDTIRYPPLTRRLDYEIELVAVIGVHEIDPEHPLDGVLGYTVGNDVSARDLQVAGPVGVGMDLLSAKSQDDSTPVGPWIVTRDEFPGGSPKLTMTLKVNGEIRQDANSGEMTWGVDALIAFIDSRTSFGCGDLLFTGSPDGIGHASSRYLQPGDHVEAHIEGVGTLRNTVGNHQT